LLNRKPEKQIICPHFQLLLRVSTLRFNKEGLLKTHIKPLASNKTEPQTGQIKIVYLAQMSRFICDFFLRSSACDVNKRITFLTSQLIEQWMVGGFLPKELKKFQTISRHCRT